MSAPTVVAYVLVFVLSVHSSEVDGSGDAHSRSKRLAIHPSQWALHLWPGGVVPYDIASHYTDWEKAVILSGMAEFPKHTCISFRPRTASDKYYLAINKYYDLERCFSYIGRQTTFLFRTAQGNIETRMKLDPSCLRFNGRGTVMHELMHILGFYHEHQRDDRDPRVTGSASHYNYKVYPRHSTFYMGPYDRTSIMHYNFPGIVYPRSYFSASDILRINTLYRCSQKSTTTTTTTRATTRPLWWTTTPTTTTTTTTRPLWWTTTPTTPTTTRPLWWTTTPTTPTTTRPLWWTTTPTTPTTTRPLWWTTTPSTPTTRPLWWTTTPTTTRPLWWTTTPATTRPLWWTSTPSPTADEDEQISRNGIFRRMRRM